MNGKAGLGSTKPAVGMEARISKSIKHKSRKIRKHGFIICLRTRVLTHTRVRITSTTRMILQTHIHVLLTGPAGCSEAGGGDGKAGGGSSES